MSWYPGASGWVVHHNFAGYWYGDGTTYSRSLNENVAVFASQQEAIAAHSPFVVGDANWQAEVL